MIAVIGGTGREGFGLAVRWALAAQQVVIGSRSPEKAARAVERARAAGAALLGMPNPDAAAAADIIVVTVPYAAQETTLAAIREAAGGKIVVETTVPLARLSPPEPLVPAAGSAAQQAQALLPASRVVAGFHTVSAEKLKAFDRVLDEDVLLCGDDAEAKAEVANLAALLGMRGLDAGPLSEAATVERLAALIMGMNQRYRRKAIGVKFTGV